jgi:hypothetical protein
MRITCGTDLLVELGSTLELFHTTRRHRSAPVLFELRIFCTLDGISRHSAIAP